MEIIFIIITAFLGGFLFFAASAEYISGRRAAATFLLITWLMLFISSLFLLPWAYAQPGLYFKAEAEYAKTVAEQARFIFSGGALNDALKLITDVLGGIPLTFLSTLGLSLTFFDSYALLILMTVGFLGLLLMIANLAFLRSTILSLIVIAVNSALIIALLFTLPSLDQGGTLGYPVPNFAVAVLGITYSSGFVFALLILVAFNALHATWLSDQMIGPATASVQTGASRFSAGASRFSAGTTRFSGSTFGTVGAGKRIIRRPTISAPLAAMLLLTGVIMMLSALFLPLISHSPIACRRNMASLNSVLTELQRLTAELPPEIRNNLTFVPSPTSNPQDLFTSTEHKALVGAICTAEIWTHSLWFLQNGGGTWQLTLVPIVLLSVLMIVAGMTRTTAMPLSIAIAFLALVTLLALTHALATIETFGHHDDFNLRVIAVLGATQPSLGVWIPLLIAAVILPILLPFYLRESKVL